MPLFFACNLQINMDGLYLNGERKAGLLGLSISHILTDLKKIAGKKKPPCRAAKVNSTQIKLNYVRIY